MTLRKNRSGFATIEISIVSPIFLAIGLTATLILRWLFATSHWATWTSTVVMGIPFLIAYGFIAPMIALSILRFWISGRL